MMAPPIQSERPFPAINTSLNFEEARALLPPGPRVGILHDWLNGMRGGEKVLEVILEIFPDAPIYTLFLDKQHLSSTITSHPIRASLLNRVPGSGRLYRHMLPLMPMVMESPKFRDIDLLISTSHCVVKAARAPRRVPHVSYIHAPMRYIWDQFPEYFGPGKASLPARALMTALRRPLQWWDRATAGRADYLIFNSQNIASRVARHWGRSGVVVPPPVDLTRFRPAADGLPPAQRPAWLVVSALVPYKRVDLAIAACAHRGEPLVVAGRGPEKERLEQLARELKADATFLGWIDDDTLSTLYQQARGLLFPGEEDFGITPLEAMASTTPVVALARGGALETVAPGVTGVLFDTPTVDAMAGAMGECMTNAWSSDRLRQHAHQFGRDQCRLRLAQVLASVMLSHGQ